MATEQILDGQYYRRLKDATNNIWERISFWTKAKDVYLEDGTTVESKIAQLQAQIDNLSSSSEKTIDTSKISYNVSNDSCTTYILDTLNSKYFTCVYTDVYNNVYSNGGYAIQGDVTNSLGLAKATSAEVSALGYTVPSGYGLLCFSDANGRTVGATVTIINYAGQ